MLRSLVAQTELNKKIELEIVRNGKPMNVSDGDSWNSRSITRRRALHASRANLASVRRSKRRQRRMIPWRTKSCRPTHRSPGWKLKSLRLIWPDGSTCLRGCAALWLRDVDASLGEVRKGDVIEEVNQQPVNSVADYRKVVSSLDPNGTHVLSVCRRRTRSFVVIRSR